MALLDLERERVERTANEISAAVPGCRVRPIAADVSLADDSRRAVAETLAEFGALQVVVNNAAVREFFPLAETSEQSWKRIIETNLLGTANCCKAALPALRKSKGATIVNVSSVYGVVARGGMGQYDATKAAILALTRALAFEEAEHGIRVNAVCPGSTLTPFTLGRAAARGMSEEELKERGAAPSLLNRWAQPEEIAYPFLWLASEEASFITGATLMVDGGLSAI